MADTDPGLALEQFITAQFESLSLSVPSDDVEMMARFVEEELEREDKIEGVKGMLEGVVEVSWLFSLRLRCLSGPFSPYKTRPSCGLH